MPPHFLCFTFLFLVSSEATLKPQDRTMEYSDAQQGTKTILCLSITNWNTQLEDTVTETMQYTFCGEKKNTPLDFAKNEKKKRRNARFRNTVA